MKGTSRQGVHAESVAKAHHAARFNGVKVFSATMVADRDKLGEKVTEWIEARKAGDPQFQLIEIVQTQSSDESFHCIALSVFYWEPTERQAARGSIRVP